MDHRRREGTSLGAAAEGPSPFVAELKTFSTRYHENPARLDGIREGLRQAVGTDPQVDNLVALAQVCFIWGDVRATTREQKLQAYEEGREAGRRAIELAPRNAVAHFWYATNTGRWGQTNSLVRSMFLLPTVREEMRIIQELDPNFTPGYALAGNVFYEVPRLFGGDLDRAEEMFRKGLKKGRIAEARRQLQAVLDEREPRNLADWTVRDSRDARALPPTAPGRSPAPGASGRPRPA